MVCQVQSRPEGVPVNIRQRVAISWSDPALSDQETGFYFTYKPDPVLADIHPTVTILRYQHQLQDICYISVIVFH